MHDDHHRASDEAHVLSLRLALGTILSPVSTAFPQPRPHRTTPGAPARCEERP